MLQSYFLLNTINIKFTSIFLIFIKIECDCKFPGQTLFTSSFKYSPGTVGDDDDTDADADDEDRRKSYPHQNKNIAFNSKWKRK